MRLLNVSLLIPIFAARKHKWLKDIVKSSKIASELLNNVQNVQECDARKVQ